MKGKPKYKHGDKVSFKINDTEYTGEVYIIDKYGTWDDSSDVSYDIMVQGWHHPDAPEGKLSDCLFKHITESKVYVKEE